MKAVLLSLSIISISLLLIGQTSKKEDFDAQAKYKLLERYIIALIKEQRKTDAKVEELESELKEVSARIKIQSALIKQLDSPQVTKNRNLSSFELDYRTKSLLDEIEDDIEDLKIHVSRHESFFGLGFTGLGPLETLRDLQIEIGRKSDSLHFH